jgi:hypothetical protein
MDGWNALDFMCVCLGAFAIVTTILVESGVLSGSAISSEMLLIRLGRVFKMIRIMRVVVLVKFVRKMYAKINKEQVSPQLASHLDLIFTLRGFVKAHVNSHRKFLRYFGAQLQRCACGNKMMPDSNFCRKCGSPRPADMPLGSYAVLTRVEHARCIVESWTAIFKATVIASSEIQLVDAQGEWILEGLVLVRDSSAVIKTLSEFVHGATTDGVLLVRDAERIIHPMYEQLRKSERLFADTHAGIHKNDLRRKSEGASPPGSPRSPKSPRWPGKSKSFNSNEAALVTEGTTHAKSKSLQAQLEDIALEQKVSDVFEKVSDSVLMEEYVFSTTPRGLSFAIAEEYSECHTPVDSACAMHRNTSRPSLSTYMEDNKGQPPSEDKDKGQSSESPDVLESPVIGA